MKRRTKPIRVRGARQNNLKGVNLDLMPGKVTVITGLSGAGKSSLLFEVLHAEGQRRYVETFNPYVRQFLETMPRPKVDTVENIRPSIVVEQRNSVRNSRSTVGTMTELCDYFKVWFPTVAKLLDPSSGKLLREETSTSLTRGVLKEFAGKCLVFGFRSLRPDAFPAKEFLGALIQAGYVRASEKNSFCRIEELLDANWSAGELLVGLEKITILPDNRKRIADAVSTALKLGNGEFVLFNDKGKPLCSRFEGLRSPVNGVSFAPSSPSLFSFNSPLGACPRCKGFGRIIEIDYRRVIPDHSLSIVEGAIRAFRGEVYGRSQQDLIRVARKRGFPLEAPWSFLSETEKAFILDGEDDYVEDARMWYGLRRFFRWLESKTYKMHVRVFLSKYRSYVSCPDCEGTRLSAASLLWRWRGNTLPDLYAMPIAKLDADLQRYSKSSGNHRADLALEGIRARLGYLEQVGLNYLSLDRPSKTLSGGEMQRVNLTACLGASLTETLFALDEPSIGLHAKDVDRLIGILRELADQGNAVCVVEHDERIIRAADQVIEIGPSPGAKGGRVTFRGSVAKLEDDKKSITGAYLSGRKSIDLQQSVRNKKILKQQSLLRIRGASSNNICKLDLDIPIGCFVVLAGVSGSGKSTLLHNIIREGLLAPLGNPMENSAIIDHICADVDFAEIVTIDQTPIGKTPRSNPALFADAWNPIRSAFARTDDARRAGLSASHFSFNSKDGRCEGCEGLGYERIEMQFLADVFTPCPACEGRRFKDEILSIRLDGLDVTEVLSLSVTEAIEQFSRIPRAARNLNTVAEVGLGYLSLGQPLSTLSGGESQRLKLAKYITQIGIGDKPSLLLVDEPTTGLHRDDVACLLQVIKRLTGNGHSLIVIEHQLDIIANADQVIELGPGAGGDGGKVIAQGLPRKVAKMSTSTGAILADYFNENSFSKTHPTGCLAEDQSRYRPNVSLDSVRIDGARENNLKNLSLNIPLNALTVVTGPSGSGKSSLAFDIVFAEGQRRFLESMSSYARQFVEQLPRPAVDAVSSLPPTVAIEQRVTRGTRKSTVGTITEVAHYLRLLFARIGIQHSPSTGAPVESSSVEILLKRLSGAARRNLKKNKYKEFLYLCSPLVRGRKGHHRPLATWAASKGYELLRCNGSMVSAEGFEGLSRYAEHDVDLVVRQITRSDTDFLRSSLEEALSIGKGSAYLFCSNLSQVVWLSTARVDLNTGEAFPQLQPKLFSWNSPRGWCPVCRGYGRIDDRLKSDLSVGSGFGKLYDGDVCVSCNGDRIAELSRSVFIRLTDDQITNLPDLLRLTPPKLLRILNRLEFDDRSKAIAEMILPEIRERLAFMESVGLDYLSLDRATTTLSGGEAQRIRLASQLGSNLSGALYVLDEPSIGLHAKDNQRLLESLEVLKAKGNTLLVVEHDEETMLRADHIIDLGPGAGESGGWLLASGKPEEVLNSKKSLTAKFLREGLSQSLGRQSREMPRDKPNSRSRKISQDWFGIIGANIRNIQNIDVWLPVNRLIALCGVSGAGKSTLARGLIKPAVVQAVKTREPVLTSRALLDQGIFPYESCGKAPFRKVLNGNRFAKVIEVDQSPIGKTPRSSPATYIGAWDRIRSLLSSLPEAQVRGLGPKAFSFNVKGGRCETCKGAGRIKLEMNFLPDAYILCEDCGGLRYSPDMLNLRWKGKNIAEILQFSFLEAADFFSFDIKLKAMMGLMVETGLGYLSLGQSSPTLSGGEAQRVKLVSEMSKGILTRKNINQNALNVGNLYILEEPSIGLHSTDCVKLMHLLHRLVDDGHTVIVIEHNLDLLANADYLVEIGPKGGDDGGKILFSGKPEEIVKVKGSPTAPYLKPILNN